MGWTKRDYIEQAFDEVGLAGFIFDLSPEQLQTALRKLDSMMGTWDGKGIQVGWPVTLSPNDSDLDTEVPFMIWANEAIFLNLGIRLASTFGKQVSNEIKTSAKLAYDSVLLMASRPREMQFPRTLPSGAGNKPWRIADDPFIRPPDTGPIFIDPNGQLDFGD